MFIVQNDFGWLGFAMSFVWGFTDSCISTQLYEICAFEFNENGQSLAIYNLVESMAEFFIEIAEAFIAGY